MIFLIKGETMSSFLKALGAVFTFIMIIVELCEILALPALFVIIGLLNAFPWQYYAVTVGGYFFVGAIIQLICHFLFKKLERKYESTLLKFFLNKR